MSTYTARLTTDHTGQSRTRVTRNAAHSTHKRGTDGRTQTIARRQARAQKMGAQTNRAGRIR